MRGLRLLEWWWCGERIAVWCDGAPGYFKTQLDTRCGTATGSSNTATSRAKERKEVKTAVAVGDEGSGDDRGGRCYSRH
jgi:hypothetical protein